MKAEHEVRYDELADVGELGGATSTGAVYVFWDFQFEPIRLEQAHGRIVEVIDQCLHIGRNISLDD